MSAEEDMSRKSFDDSVIVCGCYSWQKLSSMGSSEEMAFKVAKDCSDFD
jgi:hypothetical protein